MVTAVNVSNSLTAMPQVTVEFLHGSSVDGQDYTPDDPPDPAPGQSEQPEADIGAPGAGSAGDTCQITSYPVFTQGSRTVSGTYQVSS